MLIDKEAIHKKIKDVLAERKIKSVGFIPAEKMDILNPRLLPEGFHISSCIAFLVPYKTPVKPKDNLGISSYARVRDYHSFIKELYSEIIPEFENIFKGEKFFGFADSSPINEKLAAAKANLGIIGKNSLLINDTYGSYVFIGSLLTTLKIPCESFDVKSCGNCSVCCSCCPAGAIIENGINSGCCLSAVSQKKKIDDNELKILKEHNIAWGCDICQDVCPLNQKTEYTDIDYFITGFLEKIDLALIEGMDDDEYHRYPFSWRKKEVLLRNIININTSET